MEPPATFVRSDRTESIRPSSAFLLKLRVAVGALGEHTDLASADHGGDDLPAATGGDWEAALRATLDAPAALVRRVPLSVRDAAAAARKGAPLTTFREGTGWIALLERSRDRHAVLSAEGRTVWRTVREIERELGVSGDRAIDWLVVEAGLGGAAAPAGEKLAPFRRLMQVARPERRDIVAIVLYSAFIGLLTLAIPVAVQQLVNTVAFGGLLQPVVVLAFLLLMGLTIAASISAFQAYLAEILQRRIFVRACVDLANRLPRVAADAFGPGPAPAFVNRFFDLVTVQKMGARLLLEGSAVVLQTLAGLVVLSFYHPLMLALSVILVGSMGVVAFVFGRHATKTAIRESSAKYDLAEWLEELVRHQTAFRTRGGRERATSQADSLVAAWVDARRRHYRIVFRQFAAALGLQVVVNTLLLALGGFLVVSGELTLGQLVASEIIVAAVVAAFARLAKHFEAYYDLLAAVDKVGGLLDLPLERIRSARPDTSSERSGALAARGVTISFAGRKVLDRVSLDLAAGEKAALIGNAGSGKSVLLDVLAGIRAPDDGYVTLGGRDLRELDPGATHDSVLVVREPQILPTSVAANLTLARPDVSADEARAALDRVGLLDEVRALPDGLRTRLRTDGSPLSRSQAARLEIARAIVARPAALLIDDALLAIDDEALKPALDALFDESAPWTLLAVSREERVLRRAQRIIDLDTCSGAAVADSGHGEAEDTVR
jgi:ABC-type bacteriocin/lantibiotic exporter with double-glycine peptidase domain